MRMILAAVFALMVLAAYVHAANTPHFRDAWCLAFHVAPPVIVGRPRQACPVPLSSFGRTSMR
jgi:hypothetical protein